MIYYLQAHINSIVHSQCRGLLVTASCRAVFTSGMIMKPLTSNHYVIHQQVFD